MHSANERLLSHWKSLARFVVHFWFCFPQRCLTCTLAPLQKCLWDGAFISNRVKTAVRSIFLWQAEVASVVGSQTISQAGIPDPDVDPKRRGGPCKPCPLKARQTKPIQEDAKRHAFSGRGARVESTMRIPTAGSSLGLWGSVLALLVDRRKCTFGLTRTSWVWVALSSCSVLFMLVVRVQTPIWVSKSEHFPNPARLGILS